MAAVRSRRFFPWLVALLLVWGQVAAFAHALTHVNEATPDKPCEVCVAQASLGSAAPPATPLAYAAPVAEPAPDTVPLLVSRVSPTPPCARDPPRFRNA